ncbi:hypothetical protein Fmac_025089 [Flemingia macrophylla]|uniref:Uncharacterized protein n=1 Tax=Flemingia macrophylla TaxID=520843 RepID=A0ABD1LRD3_9FABA
MELFIGGWASQNLSIPWKEVESKLFVLNVDKRLVLTMEDLSKALRDMLNKEHERAEDSKSVTVPSAAA